VLKQRQHDLEARNVFAHMGSPRLVEGTQEQASTQDQPDLDTLQQQNAQPPSRMDTLECNETQDEDEEELEEYEEYC
jgi:hypothetical protein